MRFQDVESLELMGFHFVGPLELQQLFLLLSVLELTI